MFVKRRKKEQACPADNRTSQRVEMAAEVTIDSDHNFYYGLSENISEGGLFVNTYQTIELGSELELLFTLPGHQGPLKVRARVQWVREHSPLNQELPAGMGLQFINPAPELLELVRGFIVQREPAFYE